MKLNLGIIKVRVQVAIKCLKPMFNGKTEPNANEIDTRKNVMYTANAKILRLGPNATYIPLTGV